MAEEKKLAKEKQKVPKEHPKNDAIEKSAIVNGRDIPVSQKQAMAVCNFIRGKNIDLALNLLEKASLKKIAIPMRGEIAHKRNMMSGRYPVTTVNEVIKLLKSLKANAMVKEMEIEKYRLACKTDLATKPYKRFGNGKFKRTHIILKLIGTNKPLAV
jgi:hypothetical protein